MSDDKEMKERRRYTSWMCDRMACGAARVRKCSPESLMLAPVVPNPPRGVQALRSYYNGCAYSAFKICPDLIN